MNQDELAALIAQTHSFSHSSEPRSPSSTTRKSFERPLRSPNSPLSPRQIFQSRVRTLSDDGNPHEGLGPLAQGRRNHLQHLSSLRFHVRGDDLSRPVDAQAAQQHQSRDGRFGFSSAEPDFVTEERAAWLRGLPDAESKHNNLQVPVGGNIDRNSLYFLEDGHIQAESPRSQLKQFAPACDPIDVEERPKTSRGPGPIPETLPGAFPQDVAQPSGQGLRKSKFLEGSMTDRSVAVASTWNEHGFRLSESSDRSDTDSDATPRASRVSRDSGSSFDVSEFQPPPTTPSTIKGKLTKLVKRVNEDQAKPREEEKKQKKKGLRKSISTWSFHNIGDKMRFFGASSSDLPETQDSSASKDENAEMAQLNERKRRAEEAYAQQFGSKKQKSNDGIAMRDTKAQRTPSQPRTLKKRPTSPRTITRATATRRRREASESTIKSMQDPTDVAAVSDSDHDHRKRPSRSELEKENQQLRAMLREQQAQRSGYMQRSATKSNVHLPLPNDTHVPTLPSSKRSTTSRYVSPSSKSFTDSLSSASSAASNPNPKHRTQQKQHHPSNTTTKRGSDSTVPPVPALPSRAVLANLSNVTHHKAPDTSTMKRLSRSNGRPVSVIFEDASENHADHELGCHSELQIMEKTGWTSPSAHSAHTTNKRVADNEFKDHDQKQNQNWGWSQARNSQTPMSPHRPLQAPTTANGAQKKETWEWPDDVF